MTGASGDELPRRFPDTEFAARLERAQRAMADARLDALLVTTEPEVRWFTGLLTPFWLSPTRPWFVVVPRTGKPVAVVGEIAGPVMARTWLDDVRTWPSPRPEDEGVSLLADTLRGIAGAVGRIGVPMGPETTLRMPLADWDRLRAALPAAAFVDATDVVRGLRMIKSEAEVARLARICAIASDAFDTLGVLAAVGRPFEALVRDFRVALLTAGADDVPYLVGAAAPGGYDDVISPPGPRPLEAGDVLMLDTGAVRDGYFCDVDRNVAIGHADDASRRAYATLYRATQAGLEVLRPGVTCAEVFAAMRAVVDADGYPAGNVGRFGHGLGMQLTEWPSFRAGDDTVLAPGMVLTLEPSLTIAPGRTMVAEEDLVLREDGPVLLTRRAPRELPVV